MTPISDHAEIKEAVGIVARLRQQNAEIFGSERAQFELRQYGFSRTAINPLLQEIHFEKIEKAHAFHEVFGEDGFNEISPDKVAFITGGTTEYYCTYQKRNPGGYEQYCKREIERFLKHLKDALVEVEQLATDRYMICNYIEAGLEFRKAKCMGRAESIEFLQDGMVYDFGYAAHRIGKPYSFENARGEFLYLETKRMRRESALLKQFKAIFIKAEANELLPEFSSVMEVELKHGRIIDAYYKELYDRFGGFSFIEVVEQEEPVHRQWSSARLHQTIGKQERLRDGGYESANDNMNKFADLLKKAEVSIGQLTAQKTKQVEQKVEQEKIEASFSHKFKKWLLGNEKPAKEAIVEAKPEKAKVFVPKPAKQAKQAKSEEILVPTRITISNISVAQSANDTLSVKQGGF